MLGVIMIIATGYNNMQLLNQLSPYSCWLNS